MQEPAVRLAGISKRFGSHRALIDVSLEMLAGRVVGLIGANGAGKTTLLRIISRVMSPDTGTIRFSDVTSGSSGVGYLPEERGLYLRQSPLRTLQFLGELRGMDPGEAETSARHWLEAVAMPDGGRRRLEQYSKGQQQKAQLAAAFLGEPTLIALDEPFAGLDPVNAHLVTSLVSAARDRGAAIMLSAHQLNLVDAISDHVVMLDRGRIAMSENWQRTPDAGRRLEELFIGQSKAPETGP
jgi:ABC-2 type transport system ATP-binding protein